MKKPKMSLTEELRKIDHINGYNKDFTLEESKRYTQRVKSRTYDLKILTEEKVNDKYKNLFTEGEIKLIKKNPQILNEILGFLAQGLTKLPMLGRFLPAVGRGMTSFGSKYLTKLPTGVKNIMGFGIKELVVLLVIVALVFGTKKIKGVGSDVGGWIRDFKKAMKEEPKESDPLEGDAQTIEAEVSSEKEEGAPR